MTENEQNLDELHFYEDDDICSTCPYQVHCCGQCEVTVLNNINSYEVD